MKRVARFLGAAAIMLAPATIPIHIDARASDHASSSQIDGDVAARPPEGVDRSRTLRDPRVSDGLMPASSPINSVLRFCLAYAFGPNDLYAQMLTADFRFVFGDPELSAQYPDGFTREDEIRSLDHLTHGFVNAAGLSLPPASKIEILTGPLEAMPDPDRPDSTDRYRLVVAPALHIEVMFVNGGRMEITRTRHEFHVARGDVAHLTAGQRAASDSWYVRRWIECPDSLARTLAARAPVSPAPAESVVAKRDSADTAVARVASFKLAVLRHPNPACWPLAVEFSLPSAAPAEIALVDVMGRVMTRREIVGSRAGRRWIDLGGGVRLAPGVYWIRLAQSERSVSSRLVVLR